jgi:hypothetical protein
MILLAVSIACGIAGLACFDTYTTPGVIFFGIALCAVFVVPIGIVAAITGMEVTLNVLAEFIGGSLGQGNALSMNYFKTYGQVTPYLLEIRGCLRFQMHDVPQRHQFRQ